MLVVLIKTITIQFEDGVPYFINAADGNDKIPTRTVEREPRRGQIVDINYRPLVTSVSFYDIHMDPTVAKQEVFDKDLHTLCVELNKMYPSKSVGDYEYMIRNGRTKNSRYLLIKKKATNDERKKLREMPIFEHGRLGGGLIDNEEIIIRKRPHGELMKRTLGYVKTDGDKVRMVGIEGAFNEYLKGEPGEDVEQRISTGWKKIGPILKEPVEGATVVTTIDKEIQEVAHTELLNQLELQQAESGCVIVMDVKTGYVKAIVNLNKSTNGIYYESYNKAIGTKEVPGSTFKLASLMALLEDGKVSISDMVNAKGVYRFYKDKLVDSHPGGYGIITIQQAFEKSSNVFSEIVNTAYKTEPQAYIDRLKSFGLADSLGISIEGEPKPTMYEPGMKKSWHGGSLPWMAIGYEFQQTPLQTLAFYNAVANNGTFVRPLFVKEIVRGSEIIKRFPPEVIIDKVCSEKTLNDLHVCLEGVVKRGTGTALESALFDIAGKTGTARVLNNENGYSGDKKYQASFCGYFPAENPIYSCIVVVSGPTRNIYGSVVSGTVFTAIANKVYATSLKYHKPINANSTIKNQLPVSKDGNLEDLKQIYKTFNVPFTPSTNSTWVNTFSGGEKISFTKRYIGEVTVPNVKGLSAKDAVYLIEKTGMTAEIKGYGKVVEQSILPGQKIFIGGVVEIKLK